MRRVITALALVLSLQTAIGRLGTGFPQGTPGGGGGSNTNLLQQTNFVYAGSFALPTETRNSTNGLSYFGYSGVGAIAYNSVNDSLFITSGINGNHQSDLGLVAEIQIPAHTCPPVTGTCSGWAVGNSTSGGSTNLTDVQAVRATWIQDFFDVTNGALAADAYFGSVQGFIFGLHVYGGKLYGAVMHHYGGDGQTNFFRHDLTLSGSTFFGWETVRDASVTSTYGLPFAVDAMAGTISDVPSQWQSALGGPAIAGSMYGVAVTARVSQGASAFIFDPAQIGSDTPSSVGNVASSSPVAATGLVYYPLDHPTLGAYDDGNSTQNPYTRPWKSWNDRPAAGIIEDGTYFVPTETGVGHAVLPCTGTDDITAYYGKGTWDSCLNGLDDGDGGGHKWGYDTAGSNPGAQGNRSFPYKDQVLLYAVSDLVKVKAGTTNPGTGQPWKPWEIIPYAKFDLPFPFDYYGADGATKGANGSRCTYDAGHRLLYCAQTNSLDQPGQLHPMAHVFRLTPATP